MCLFTKVFFSLALWDNVSSTLLCLVATGILVLLKVLKNVMNMLVACAHVLL